MRYPLLCLSPTFILLASCDSASKPSAADAKPSSAASESAAADSAAAAKTTFKAVSETGTKFDPPVEKSELPHDAYICDMGTVHFATTGDGSVKCPSCGMKLVKNDGKPATAGDHSGHDHADH